MLKEIKEKKAMVDINSSINKYSQTVKSNEFSCMYWAISLACQAPSSLKPWAYPRLLGHIGPPGDHRLALVASPKLVTSLR